MAIYPSDFRAGTSIMYNNEPYTVMSCQLVNVGRGGAIYRTKLRGIKNPKIIEQTFKPSNPFEPVDKESKKMQYLYNTGDAYVFMDAETFDQIEISEKILGDKGKFLQDGMEIYVDTIDGEPFDVQLPTKMVFTVESTTPGVKGDTASGGTKPATLDNGVVINVPLFVKEGDKVRINPETGDYVERA